MPPQNPYDAIIEREKLRRPGGVPTPGPSTTTNPYDAIVTRPDEVENQKMRAAALDTKDTTPDRRAEALKIATRLNLPVELVERNFDQLKTRFADEKEQTPYTQVQREAPAVARFQTDPNNAAVSGDDLANLGALEWVLTAPGRAFAQQINGLRYAELRTKSLFRPLTREEQDQMNAYKFHQDAGGKLSADSFFAKAITGAGRLLAQAIEPAKQSIIYGAEGAIAGALYGGAGGPGGALAGASTGLLWGARTGAVYGVMSSTAMQETAGTYDELLSLKVDGKTIDPDIARVAALTVGGLNGFIEQIGLEAFLKRFPGLDKIASGMGRQAMKQALQSPSVRAAFKQLAKSYAGGLSVEVATEVAQRGITIAGEELAKYAEGPTFAAERRTATNVWDELVQEAASAVPEFALGMLPGPTLALAREVGKAKQAEANVAFFNALNEGVAQSKTAQRMPAAFEALVKDAVANGPVKDIYAPTDSWRVYWQSQGDDPAARAAEVTGRPDAWDEAQRTGNLRIPTERYATQLAGTEHAPAFVNELRLGDPDAKNGREMEEFKATIDAVKQAVTDQVKKERETAQTAAIEQQLTDQLVAAGVPRGTATTQARALAGVGQLAERAGLDPAETLGRYGLQIDRRTAAEATQEGETVIGQPDSIDDEQAGLTRQDEGTGPALAEALTGNPAPPPELQAELDADFGQPLTIKEEAAKLIEDRVRAMAETDQRGDELHPELGRERDAILKGYIERRSQLGASIGRVLGRRAADLEGLPPGVRIDNAEPGEARPDGVRAKFIGYQEGGPGQPTMALYNIIGGDADGSTVTVNTLYDNHIPIPPTPPVLEFYQRAIASQPSLLAWFGNSVVVDQDGKPLVVYHGTTRTFTTFDQERANVEADFGRGFYFSNNPEDVGVNYAGIGPDLKSRIEMESERMAADYFYDEGTKRQIDQERGITGDAATEPDDMLSVEDAANRIATKAFVEHGGMTIPVFLKIENPAVVGGEHGGTMLDMEVETDQETGEFTGEEHGKLLEFIDALERAASQYHDGSVDAVKAKLYEEGIDGGITLTKAISIIKEDEQFGYHTDDEGRLVSDEIIRQALEDIGFDGIIDHTVNIKFGSQRRTGKAMAGMDEDTVHYIVFKPEQIKSALFNRGTFDPVNPNILFQSAIEGSPERSLFYSRLVKAVEDQKQNKASGQQWKAAIKNAKIGVNKDEFAITRLEDLEDKTTYTKDEVLAYIARNRPDVGVVILGGAKPEIDIDDEELRERAQEIHDRMVDDAIDNVDWSEYTGRATTVEEEVEREEEVEVEETDEHGNPVLDEDGDPVMTTETRTEYVTVYYPAIEGGRRRHRRRGYGTEWRDGTEVIEDADQYDDEDDAQSAAEDHVDDLRDDDAIRDYVYDVVREEVDWSDAEREARDELEGRGGGETDDGSYGGPTHYETYVLDPKDTQEEGSYREVFLTAGKIQKPESGTKRLTPEEVKERIVQEPDPIADEAVQAGQLEFTAFADERIERAVAASKGDLTDPETHARIRFDKSYEQLSPRHQRLVEQDAKQFEPAYYKWRDGHGSYDDIENPIVRIRLNIRRVAGPLVEPIEPNSDIMQKATDAAQFRSDMMAKYSLSEDALDSQQYNYTTDAVLTFDEREKLRQTDGAIRQGKREQQRVERMNKRRVPGERMLFIEEVQPPKDQEQPKMPPLFLKNWREIAFKWALRYATDNGLSGIAWTTGQQQVDRYSLSHKVKQIHHAKLTSPIGETRYYVRIDIKDGYPLTLNLDDKGIVQTTEPAEERWEGLKNQPIAGVLGPEIAEKILGGTEGTIEGKKLRVGGTGLRRLYDVDFKGVANKLPALKAHGVSVTTVPMVTEPVYYIDEEIIDRSPVEEAEKRNDMAQEVYGDDYANLAEDDQEYIRERVPQQKIYELSLGGTSEVLFRTESYEEARQWQSDHHQAVTQQPAIQITPEMAAAVQGGQALFQPGRTPRGSIAIGPNRSMRITLFERADLSTFLHEAGHFYLEVFGDIVETLTSKDPATLNAQQQQLLGDWQTILSHLGVSSRAEIQREQHELFARSFEAYLMEGKAPSIRLRETFARVRAWMLGIYRSLRALNAPLTPEVRKVFDRMLATDDAIAAAEQAGRMEPLFLTPEQAGMSHERFELYRQAIEDASNAARAELDNELIAEVRREQTAEWKARKAQVRQEVTAAVHKEPVYRAIAAMSRGTKPDGSPLVEGEPAEPIKLSKNAIVEQFGPERLVGLPKSIYSAEGGVHGGVVAEMYGFSSADELLTAVQLAPPMQQRITNETDRRMLLEHGSILLDGTLHERAKEAAAGELREHVLREELRALARLQRQVSPFEQQTVQASEDERNYERRWFEAEAKLRIAIAEGRKQAIIDDLEQQVRAAKQATRIGPSKIRGALPGIAALREAAQATVARTKVQDLNSAIYWSAARRASEEATNAAARQDFPAAILAKQQELISLALFREIKKVKADVAKRVKRAKAIGAPSSLAKLRLAGETYFEQVAAVLDRFEFATIPKKDLVRRAALWKWVQGQEAQGLAIDLPEELLDENRAVNYQELTVEELIGVTDGLKQLVHQARFKNRLLANQKKRSLKALTTKLAASIRENKSKRQKMLRDRGQGTERKRKAMGVLASHRKLSSLLREMDGFEDAGPMHQAIMRPLNEAGAREAAMHAEATKKFAAIIDGAYKGSEKRQLYARTFIPAIGESLSKMERLMIALNWGNAGNRDRVMRAEGWTQEQVQAVLDTLDERDAQFVQEMFDFIGSYWDQIAAKSERVHGVRPKKVEALPFRILGTELPGGYFPLKYDDRMSASAASQLDLEAANLAKQAAFVQATTARGHEKARVESLDEPVRLDFGVMFEHVAQVIHDLSHHEALIDVGRILASKDVQTAIYETHGDIAYKTIKNTVRDIAFGDLPAVDAFETALNHTRTGATVVGLGWNMTTAALQWLGFANTIVRIGPLATGRGIARLLGSPSRMNQTVQWVYEKSLFMKTRGLTQQREINEIRNRVGIYSGKLSGWVDEALAKTTFNLATRQGIADSYFWFIQTMQKTVDIPTWLGAYDAAIRDGHEEDVAISIADQAVLDSQGGGQIKDLSSVQRGGPALKLWTNFYSYFNVVYNQAVESGKRAAVRRDAAGVGRAAADYAMLFIVPATLGYFVRQWMKPGDDDEPLAEALIRENLSYMAGMMVGLRELGGAIGGYYGYEGPAGARAFASASKTIRQVTQVAEADDKAEALDEAFWRSINETLGLLLHYPATQAWKTSQGMSALIEGKTENPLVLVSGPEKK